LSGRPSPRPSTTRRSPTRPCPATRTPFRASLILPAGAEKKFFNQADATANGWKYDKAGAEKLLTDAGATKGGDGVYTLNGARLGPWKLITPTGWTDWNASCEIIATSLKAIGMDVSTNFPQQAEVTQAVQGGSFDMAVWYVSGVNPATPWARFKDVMSQAEMKPVGTDDLRQLRSLEECRR